MTEPVKLNFTCPFCHAQEAFHDQGQFDMIVRHMVAHAARVPESARQVWELNIGSIGDGCQWTEAHFQRTMAQLIAAIRTSPMLDMTEKRDMVTEVTRLSERGGAMSEKIAPVQGYSAGIPWSMHLRAYDVYCEKYGSQQALIDLEGRNCRGGFGVDELDDFIPGWRGELNEINQLKALLRERDERIAELEPALEDVRRGSINAGRQ